MDDVTVRIKCDLADAFASRTRGPSWLSDWTVKADLTLQANEQGGISPSGSYTKYQRSAVNAAAGSTTSPGTALGTVQQFFTLSLAANAGEQAVRTEVLSFSVSLNELGAWRRDRGLLSCDAPQRQELLGNLGIREWVDAALSPVERGVLLAGKHPAPNAGNKPSQPAIVAKPASIPTASALVLYQSTSGTEKIEMDKLLGPELAAQVAGMKSPAGLSADTGRKVVEAVTKVLPPPRPSVATATRDSLDADAELVSVNGNIETVHALVADLSGKLARARLTTASYSPVSTTETVSRLRLVRSRIATDLALAEHVQACLVQQLCGEAYGSCSGFHDLDGVGGKDSRRGSATCVADVPTCPGPEDVGVTGVLRERACVKAGIGDADIAARLAQSYAATARSLTDFIQKSVADAVVETPDPPLDGLGHSVQFVVAYGASVTPNWTLIDLKLPGMNAPAVAISANRTHLLQLALGPTTAVVPTEQNRIITNQNLLNR